MKSDSILKILVLFTLIPFIYACSSTSSGKEGLEGMDGDTLSEADLNAQREARFAGGSIPLPEEAKLFRDIPFGFDSANLSSEARQNIEYNLQILERNPGIKIQLEGHCDERGTNEYNMALGSERSRSVKEMLTSLGVPINRLETISYGEEVPIATGSNESAWSQNRRVHFSPYR